MEENKDQQNDKAPSRIDKLKEAIYSRNTEFPNTFSLDLRKHNTAPKEEWEGVKEENPSEDTSTDKSGTVLRFFLIASLIFFIGAFSYAALVYFKGSNVISPSNIGIEVIGPISAPAGEPVSFDVAVTNKNEVPIILADLLVEYPKGTKKATDGSTDLPRERIPVGTIQSGETIRKTISAVFFGEEGERPKISTSLEYRLETSNSVFTKDGGYEFLIGSSPVAIEVSVLGRISVGQELPIEVTVTSNSKEVIKDVILTADLPFGYELRSANPATISGKNVWSLGDMAPQSKKKITLKGSITGGQSGDKYFIFSIGGRSKDDPSSIASLISRVEKGVVVEKPFVSTQIALNSHAGSDTYVAKSGKSVPVKIDWKNNLSVPVIDAVVEAKVLGPMVDKKSLNSNEGFYRASENLIRWTKFESKTLEVLEPGAEGVLNFDFLTYSPYVAEGALKKNQEVDVQITVKGKRLSENNVPEELITTTTRKIKLEADSRVVAQIVQSIGPFQNAGTIPAHVEKLNQYTVTWTVTNTLNDIDGARVTATLPSYIDWTGRTSPGTEKISYDKDSRQVVWDLGKVYANGGEGSLRQVSFQIAFTPSLSQVGLAPDLLSVSTLSAKDTFTETNIINTFKVLTTILQADPQYDFGEDKILE